MYPNHCYILKALPELQANGSSTNVTVVGYIFSTTFTIDTVNVYYVIADGQGQWPVAGAEKTVMQSTVIINCTRGRGGFYFSASHNITIEVTNCGGLNYEVVFKFNAVQQLFKIFSFKRIQYNT